MLVSNSLTSLSHHAYCLIGSESVRADLKGFLEKKHAIRAHANPDFFDRTYQTFAIDDAREVKSAAEMRPIGGSGGDGGTSGGRSVGTKIFILTMDGITVEAQNALLKLLEEPPEYAHFFLIIPSAHVLLPTVKSRVAIIEQGVGSREKGAPRTQNTEIQGEAAAFLKMSAPKRLDHIKKLMEDIGKEKKTKQDAVEFLDAIQETVYERKGIKEGKSALETVELARTYATDRAPSLKMLLEYVALNI